MTTTTSVPTLVTDPAADSRPAAPRHRRTFRPLDIHAAGAALPRQSSRVVPYLAVGAVLVSTVYVAYQRIGTTANADSIVLFEDLTSGYVALGMTETQPGFVLLSALEKDKVSVSSRVYSNRLAGRFTIVDVQTPAGRRSIRLRGPRVLLVDEQGRLDSLPVDWTYEQFVALLRAMDCAADGGHSGRCGRPMHDMLDEVGRWPMAQVPAAVRAFLERGVR